MAGVPDFDDLADAADLAADAYQLVEILANPGTRELRFIAEYAEELAAEFGIDLG